MSFQNSHSTPPENSVLVIGATGRTGLAVIRQLAQNNYSTSTIHAFCRDASKLPSDSRVLCASVQEGNARDSETIEHALDRTQANWVVISVGNGDSVAKTDVRQVCAEAIVQVLQMPQYQHVRAIVVSSIGAGGSKMKIGMGIGHLVSYQLRHVLKDHTKQEAAFLESPVSNRTTVVRATSLVDAAATGKHLVEFGDRNKCPTIKTSRDLLAARIAWEINRGQISTAARVFNLTNAKQ